jgi:hypothetical protein
VRQPALFITRCSKVDLLRQSAISFSGIFFSAPAGHLTSQFLQKSPLLCAKSQ